MPETATVLERTVHATETLLVRDPEFAAALRERIVRALLAPLA